MGYFVYITKADYPIRSKEDPISASEWKLVVRTDPDLAFDGRGVSTVVWWDEFGDEKGRMVLQNGRVLAKNPTDEMILKMKNIASLLSARVQGDDGTLY